MAKNELIPPPLHGKMAVWKKAVWDKHKKITKPKSFIQYLYNFLVFEWRGEEASLYIVRREIFSYSSSDPTAVYQGS